uniref:Protein HID1 n=1 Tax=Timema douglasi TaxID=61478 RepID=A0A7R8VLF5_TIMDO|nr:unnamed protein product [Timema douglasi]
MGNADTKLNFRKAVVQLTSKTQPINASDDSFWDQFWAENVTNIQDVFTLVPAVEIRALREEAPSNLATLCYKAVEKMVKAVDNSCRTHHEQQTGRRATRLWTTVASPTTSNRQVGEATRLWTTVASPTMSNRQVGEQPGCGQQLPHLEQQTVLNCIRLLTRLLPYIFEDPDWRGFFWSSLPGQSQEDEEEQSMPLAQSLINAICDLLFCPDFTVVSNRKSGPDKAEDLQCIDSCEYIWESGVGFAHSPPRYPLFDTNRTELLKLLLTCFSETMYQPPFFTCPENRHALPLFTSLLNTVCAYDPVGLGVPYNHIIFSDTLEPLVDTAMQILIVTLDHDTSSSLLADGEEESLVFFWKMCDYNKVSRDTSTLASGVESSGGEIEVRIMVECIQGGFPLSVEDGEIKKFLYYVLKSSDVLEILVPILYHLNDSRADQSRVGLMHIGVFILLLLSGERNFGVRLNKPYTATIPMDIPVFTGRASPKTLMSGSRNVQKHNVPVVERAIPKTRMSGSRNVEKHNVVIRIHVTTTIASVFTARASPETRMSGSRTHADLLITVFHKIITTGHQRLQPLFDCLLTILVNGELSWTDDLEVRILVEYIGLSPYLKTLSMVASTKLLHLLEAFSTPWFLFSSPTNHHLVFFLLEIFNNIIQYQFDGIDKMTEKESAHPSAHQMCELASTSAVNGSVNSDVPLAPGTSENGDTPLAEPQEPPRTKRVPVAPDSPSLSIHSTASSGESKKTSDSGVHRSISQRQSIQLTDTSLGKQSVPGAGHWVPTSDWVHSWKSKLPLQTIMRLLQVLVPQVEKICIDKGLTDESEILKFLQHGTLVGLLPVPHPILQLSRDCVTRGVFQGPHRREGLTDESEILKFLQHGTLVGLLPVPHPILIRKYQANCGTTTWFRTYMWGVIYLRCVRTPSYGCIVSFSPHLHTC